MNLKKLLGPDTIALDLTGENKKEIITAMVDMLHRAGRVPDREAALEAVLEREKKMSTGMQHGIAIPHAKTPTVDTLIAGLAFKPEGVDFDSVDGQPATIFVMTLSPTNRTGPHIQFLAEIGHLLHDADIRKALLAAKSAREVLLVLGGGRGAGR